MRYVCKFGGWAVTRYGLEYLGRTPYEIHKTRLWENWIPHMEEKNWVDMSHFCAALDAARKYHEKEKK